jgi:hypothetical protein
MDARERARRDNEALAALDKAIRLGAPAERRGIVEGSDDASVLAELAAADERGAAAERDTVSADEQIQLGHVLIEHAEWLEAEGRAREAFPFLRAVDALPKWGEDVELLAKLYRLALELDLRDDARRFRRRLTALDPGEFPPQSSLPPPPPRRSSRPFPPVERYSHPKFGVGTLVGREPGGLRIRFPDGERVIVEARLTRV